MEFVLESVCIFQSFFLIDLVNNSVAAWNGTQVTACKKIAPAVAAGNTMGMMYPMHSLASPTITGTDCSSVFKASEKSPLGAIALGELVKEAGFPPGVINIVSGPGKTGSLIASHMKIYKISFTGSIAAGRKVQDAATKSNLKVVTLERKLTHHTLVIAHMGVYNMQTHAISSRRQISRHHLQRRRSTQCTRHEFSRLPRQHRTDLRCLIACPRPRENRSRVPQRPQGEIRKHVRCHGRSVRSQNHSWSIGRQGPIRPRYGFPRKRKE